MSLLDAFSAAEARYCGPQDGNDAFGIATWVSSWGAQQGFATDDARLWSRAVRSSTMNGFLFAVTYIVISGVRQ